ncbi:MAG TPA: translation initiation factor IF-2, partial [Arcobacter sp.]|nr:translation initiation factor IF-2 [Arcobacter sp.]
MDDKVRVYEVAEEAGASSNEVISKAVEIGINLKSPQSTLSFDQAEELVNYMVTGKSKKAKSQPAKKPAKKDTAKTEIKIEEKKVDPVKEVIKQAEAKKEEKVKEEEKTKTHAPKPVSPKKNLAEGEAPLRRRKLTIVKKKRPQKETPQDQIKPMGSES